MRKNSSGFAKSYLSGAFPNPQRISAALPIEVPSNLAAKVHWQRKANGRPRGIARAKLYAPEQFREWAGLGGIATRNRYGKEFFREIRKVPKRYLNGYVTGKMKAQLHDMFIDIAIALLDRATRMMLKMLLESREN